MNMILHDDGHTNVINVDGLLFIDEIQKHNKEFQANSFNFIVTNPPFGSVLKQTERAYLRIDTSTAFFHFKSSNMLNNYWPWQLIYTTE